MMYVRREIVGPGASPLPLPAGSVAAKPASADELQTLPNPFLVGTQPPVPVKRGPVKTSTYELAYVQYVDEKAGVSEKGTLRWPKPSDTNTAASVVIIGGDLKDLPSKGIVAARLMVPVEQGHNKAPGKLGVVFLPAPVEKGKTVDVKSLTDVRGSGVVPQQPPSVGKYDPPTMVALDVFRDVKAIASGKAKFKGAAVRMVPDRGVDNGYTVRCDISPVGKIV